MTAAPTAAAVDPALARAPQSSPPEDGPPTSGHPGRPRTAPDQRVHRSLALAALVAVTTFGAVLRAHGLSHLGLWRDDAWAALSAHVGIGQAWRMWVTTPGSSLIDRTVFAASHGSTTWAQLPALVAGVAAIPAMYALARHFGFSRLAGLLVAATIALAPLCVDYSTRVKEYELDILLSCAVLAAGEMARRTPGRRQAAVLVVASVLSFLCSASMAPVVVGVFLALAVQTRRGRRLAWPRPLVTACITAAAGCGAVGLIFYTGISPALTRFWTGSFVTHASVGSFFSSLGWVAWRLLASVVGLGDPTVPVRLALVSIWLVVAAVGLAKNRSMLAPALCVAVAVLASVAHVEPLGTGRTDLYLYPALLLLTAAGLSAMSASVVREVRQRPRVERVAVGVVGLLVGALVTGSWVAHAWSERPVYPGVDVVALAAQIQRRQQPGDHIFVSELARYPWALAEDPHPDVRFGTSWATGFTVVSTQPDVFVVPSEYYEGDSHPRAWAAAMGRDHRLWYVWSPPLSVCPSYGALLADGWRPRTTLTATGVTATLLVRS